MSGFPIHMDQSARHYCKPSQEVLMRIAVIATGHHLARLCARGEPSRAGRRVRPVAKDQERTLREPYSRPRSKRLIPVINYATFVA